VITEGSEAATPVAVVPFGWQGSGPPAFDIAGVVGNDLGSSGRFKPMATRDMVSRPTQAPQVDFNQWRQAEVNYLVIGTLAEGTADDFTATFQLFDVVQGRSLTSFRLQAARADLRRAAHRISDMIFEEITGFPGVFSTQIAYVSVERRADGSRQFRLIVSDADGENAQRVAESTQPLVSPSWSPDARRIAYVSFEGGVSGVYVQTLRSGTRERVSARAGVNSAPAFSPDGRTLALVLSRDTGNLDIHSLDLGAGAASSSRRMRHRPYGADVSPTVSGRTPIGPEVRRSTASERRPGNARSGSRSTAFTALARACRRTASSSRSSTARTTAIASRSGTSPRSASTC
jgi:TolB protein